MENLSPITLGFLGSLAAGSLTAVGAAPVLFGRIPSRATRDLSLGFAAGVMLSASFFSLIIPALDAAEPIFENGAMPAAIVCVSILLGMGAVALMNEKLPHEHFKTGREGPEAASLRRVWLFIIAITRRPRGRGRLRIRRYRGRSAACCRHRASECARRIGRCCISAGRGISEAARLEHRGANGHGRADWRPVRGRDHHTVGTAASMGTGLCRGSDALRHQPRNHPRNPSQRPSEQGDARSRSRARSDAVP